MLRCLPVIFPLHMDAKWYRHLGGRIASFRHQAGMTQEQLAEKADIAPSYLARIEVGARRPTLDVLGRLAAALEIQLHGLLAEERAVRAAEGHTPWPRGARQVSQTLRDLSDADFELLAQLANRLRRR